MPDPTPDKKYVPWQIFAWVTGVVTVVIAGVFAIANAASLLSQDNTREIGVLRERQSQQFIQVMSKLDGIERLINTK